MEADLMEACYLIGNQNVMRVLEIGVEVLVHMCL